MSAETLSGLTRRLAEFSAGHRLHATPAQAVENAKIAMLDCIGVAVLASTQEIGDKTLRFARSHCGSGPCTVWGTPITTTMRDAAFLNGTLAHGLDYDDRNHASTYTLASAFAVAERTEAPGARALEAFIVGREVRAALDNLFSRRSSGIGPGAKGWHSNGILGPIASTCVAGKILDLDANQLQMAIGLAAGSCGALTRDGGTMAKPFRVGHAAATGVTCALLVKEGFTADETALEGRYGLLEALGPIPEEILSGLGASLGHEFELERPVRIKPFASCTATHASVEAMLRLREKHSIDSDDVEAIEADLKPYPLVRQQPKRGFEGRFSMPFCLAHVLVHHRLRPDDFVDARLQEEAIQTLIRRVRSVPDSPSVAVTLRGGRTISEPLAPPTDLKGWEQTVKKFNDSAEARLSDNQRLAVIESIAGLERVSSIQTVTRSLQTAS
jgi:2-methylcitrate dehydratase PrpD